jgi:hypothetical protein
VGHIVRNSADNMPRHSPRAARVAERGNPNLVSVFGKMPTD